MHTYVFVVNFDALAQASHLWIERRQVVFLWWMQDSNLGSLGHQIASRLNTHSQTNWAIEDQVKRSIARPYGERAFGPLDFTAGWLSHLTLAIYIYMFVVVILCSGAGKRFSNRRKTICLPFLNAGFEPWKSETPNRQQTECPLTNQLSCRGSIKNSLNSISRPCDKRAFSPLDFTVGRLLHQALAIYMYIFVGINFDALAQESGFRIEKRQIAFLWWMQVSKLGSFRHQLASRLTHPTPTHPPTLHKPTALSRIKQRLKLSPPNFIHAHIHTCFLLLILMLWHRQTIFESKGDKLSSSAKCRVRSWEVWNMKSPADWMPTHKPTDLSRIKQ